MDRIIVKVTSPPYKYKMLVINTTDKTFRKANIKVLSGDKEATTECLNVGIITEQFVENNRYSKFKDTAVINKVEAEKSCISDIIASDDKEHISFGKALIDATIFYIHSNYPSINKVILSDSSNIQCDIKPKESLDLYTYSIALHKESWYESNFGARIENEAKYATYRAKVERYASKETKAGITWEGIHRMTKINEYAYQQMRENVESWKALYEGCLTLPEFFIKLTKMIHRNLKCRFYNGWLESMIRSYIGKEDTQWIIEIGPFVAKISEERKPVFEIMDGGSYTIKGKRKIMSYKQRYHHNCRKSSKKNKSYRITQKLRQHNSR
jgi:hypothetical protein